MISMTTHHQFLDRIPTMATPTTTNENGETFAAWYAAANKVCSGISGLTLDDLADGPSWDAWNDGVPPREYAEELLSNEGFPF